MLYGIKQATESVRVAVAGDLTAVGRLELSLAQQRLEEVAEANARRNVQPSVLIATLAEMDVRSADGVEALARVAERSDEIELAIEAARFTDVQRIRLTELYADLPVTVRPHAEDSLAELRRLREQLLDPLLADCVACDDLLLPAGSIVELPPLTGTPLPPAPPPPDTAPDDVPSDGGDTPAPSGGTSGGGTSDLPSLSEPDLELPTPAPDDGRRVVPRLPGPLDDVGQTLDDTVDRTIDGVGDAVDGVGGTVGDVLDDPVGRVGDVVEDPIGEVDGVVDDVTGGLVDGLVDGLGTIVRPPGASGHRG